jgi:hypothetical protein
MWKLHTNAFNNKEVTQVLKCQMIKRPAVSKRHYLGNRLAEFGTAFVKATKTKICDTTNMKPMLTCCVVVLPRMQLGSPCSKLHFILLVW